jgi:hypothetical protein
MPHHHKHYDGSRNGQVWKGAGLMNGINRQAEQDNNIPRLLL